MPEQTENQINKIKRMNNIMIVLIILLSIILSLLVAHVSKKELPGNYIDRELKSLRHSFDSLRHDNELLSASADSVQSEIFALKQDRQIINGRIANYNNQLTAIKKEYEKISHYTGISYDSLHRLFSKRFDK